MNKPKISLLRRLCSYLLVLRQKADENNKVIPSDKLGLLSGNHPSQVRRDLGAIGLQSRPRVGIHIRKASKAIEKFLRFDRISSAFLVGAGNIGKSLLKQDHQNFGMEILAGFDTDLSLTNTQINGIKIFPLEKLGVLAKRMNVHIGIICTPANQAQEVAQIMLKANIKGIWNFTCTKLVLPAQITVEDVDLYSGLAVLSKKSSEKPTTVSGKRE